jgi:hypothetical protein
MQFFEQFARLLVAVAVGRNGIQNGKGRLAARQAQNLAGIRDGLQVISLRPARDDNQVGSLGGGESGLFRAGWRVNDGKVHPILGSAVKSGLQPRGLGIDDDWKLKIRKALLAPVGPVAGGGLRVKVDDESGFAIRTGCTGEIEPERSLPAAAFLGRGKDAG